MHHIPEGRNAGFTRVVQDCMDYSGETGISTLRNAVKWLMFHLSDPWWNTVPLCGILISRGTFTSLKTYSAEGHDTSRGTALLGSQEVSQPCCLNLTCELFKNAETNSGCSSCSLQGGQSPRKHKTYIHIHQTQIFEELVHSILPPSCCGHKLFA